MEISKHAMLGGIHIQNVGGVAMNRLFDEIF
jgi:hypothetical protein